MSRSHGCKGCVAQPASSARPSKDAGMRRVIGDSLCVTLIKKVKSTRQQRADLTLDFLLAGFAEADVCADDLALTIYQEGARHALEGQRLGGVSFRVKGHGEAGGVAGEEAARLGGVLVN